MYEMGQPEIDAVAAVLRSGQMFRYRGGEGGEVDRAEATMARMMGVRYSLALTSGTAALICGLVGMGIGPGDEVIVPAYTWLASAGAILSVGAIPVLAEVDESLTLAPADFEARITPRTRAVIPVHMGGRPCDMDRIKAVAAKHGVRVLEDACQAIGGSYRGRRLASIGDAGAFSFNQFKIITCGEGGALLTNDRRIYERGLYYHDMGCTFRGHAKDLAEPPFLGNTFRMNEVLGAILNAQFARLDGILARLRERRDWVLNAVRASGSPVRITPSADLAGDCGCNASFILASAAERERVAARAKELNPECILGSPINSGLHVYTNWTVLLERHGAHHPAMNPFLMAANQGGIHPLRADSCPRTLDILGRSAAIGIHPAMTKTQCEAIAGAICRAAERG